MRNLKEAKLRQKADKYGITPEFNALIRETKEQERFAFVKPAGRNSIYGMLPLRNAEEVKAAASWLLKYKTRLPYNDRKQAAAKILMKCSEFGYILPREEESAIFRTAGLGIGTKDVIASQLEKRAAFFERRNRPEVAALIRKLISEVQNTPLEDFYKEAAHQVAKEIDHVDKLSGIYYNYGKEYFPPEDFLFSTTTLEVKAAEEQLVPNVKTGKYYHVDDMENVNVSMLKTCLGEYDAEHLMVCNVVSPVMCKLWLKQASRAQAESFDKAMVYSGIRPYAEKLPE